MNKDYDSWKPKYVKSKKVKSKKRPTKFKKYISKQEVVDELAKKQLRRMGIIK